MAITTLDGLIAGFKPPVSFWKPSMTSEGAGSYQSLWKANGSPIAGATPPAFGAGSGYVCTNATQGALSFSNPSSGNSYLSRFGTSLSTAGMLILYDRIWTCSGLLTNTTSPQAITTPGTIGTGRDQNGLTLGHGVELWGEIYTAPGAVGATWTVNYTDQDGNSNAAAYAHPANAETVGQMVPFLLASGDTGVRGVTDFTCSISSGIAGDVGLTLLRRVAEVSIPVTGTGLQYDGLSLGLPRLTDNSCLALKVFCTSTLTGFVGGSYLYAQG